MSDKPFPNESAEYRQARDRLLEAEKALREQVEKVAALRRELPLGGAVKEDYAFDELNDSGEVVQVKLSELFAEGKDTLFLYGFMFSPAMEKACPLCTSFLDGLNGNAVHLSQRINVAVAARSPIERIREFAGQRGWNHLRLLSSGNNSYHPDYYAEDGEGKQWPMGNVFVKRDGAVHHHWGSELLFHSFASGDRRHMDQMWPLWNVLDLTPEGRGDWYPSLSYDAG